MGDVYGFVFLLMVVLYTVAGVYKGGRRYIQAKTHSHVSVSSSPAFKRFQLQFLLVYFLAMAADWMQGPYVYRLYSFYGLSRREGGLLFIVGFGSSLLLGTWVGPFADMCGRRTVCLLYCLVYALSCATKHVNSFPVLVVGRLLGGVATSLLWSAFESWMISEHHTRGYDPAWLGETFSRMTVGNGLVAVLSGLVAQWAADAFSHPVAPFDLSAALLMLCFAVVAVRWPENYGAPQANLWRQMVSASTAVRDDYRILLTGVQQSLFEGAMYAFIFFWTPALETAGAVPHGLVFASFMLALSLGGLVFDLSIERVVAWMPVLYMVAAATMVALSHTESRAGKMAAMTVFEAVVGFFWPCIATLRAAYVPEECRASVMSLFRAPLNALVCLILFVQGTMALQSVFLLCALLHAAAALAAVLLRAFVGPPRRGDHILRGV
ncbi:molybdate-anion transporter [Trypanosoma conorhini]|uniref:Molybdate-anion transporter n=1 Tax=Trypanosoma conorhini TaxID=83891 RepID=A0A422PZE6_9TRYP|nr:molybdate-anion transporter [Trypanosoma conorhini]RNF23135.1 molybdate-anion transporter [Trypanosoma conorhini]